VTAGTGEALPGQSGCESADETVPITGDEPGRGEVAGRASEAVIVPIEPDGQHNRR